MDAFNHTSSTEGPNSTVYSEKEQRTLFDLEQNSWWFKYRARVIVGLMRRYYNNKVPTIDVGGGNGYTTFVAAQNGFAMELLEPSSSACEHARERGITSTCGMLSDDYPPDSSYGQVLLLDVMEHIEDDDAFLDLIKRKMTKGGLLLITVPACMSLWNSQDEYAGHFRRYSIESLNRTIKRAGLKVLYENYFFSFLYLPHFIGRRLMERLGFLKRNEERTDEERNKIINRQFRLKKGSHILRIIELLEKMEYGRLMKNKKLLLGSSLVAIVKKE